MFSFFFFDVTQSTRYCIVKGKHKASGERHHPLNSKISILYNTVKPQNTKPLLYVYQSP